MVGTPNGSKLGWANRANRLQGPDPLFPVRPPMDPSVGFQFHLDVLHDKQTELDLVEASLKASRDTLAAVTLSYTLCQQQHNQVHDDFRAERGDWEVEMTAAMRVIEELKAKLIAERKRNHDHDVVRCARIHSHQREREEDDKEYIHKLKEDMEYLHNELQTIMGPKNKKVKSEIEGLSEDISSEEENEDVDSWYALHKDEPKQLSPHMCYADMGCECIPSCR